MRYLIIIVFILYPYPVQSKVLQYNTKHFTIHHSDQIRSQWIEKISEIFEYNYKTLGELYNHYPDGIKQVYIYDAYWQFKQATGQPIYVAAIYDGAFKLQNPKTLYKRKALKTILTHEYSHYMLDDLVRYKVPLWFNEGLALYIAEQKPQSKYKKSIAGLKEVNSCLRQKKNKDKLNLGYKISLRIIKKLISRYSWSKITALLKHQSKTFEKAFKEVFKVSIVEFEKELVQEGILD